MSAYKVNYWDIDLDSDGIRKELDALLGWSDDSENYRQTLDPKRHKPYTRSVGVNAPTFMLAMELFEKAHHYEYTQVHSVEYIGPGVAGNASYFETMQPDYSLGYWAKPLPREAA